MRNFGIANRLGLSKLRQSPAIEIQNAGAMAKGINAAKTALLL